MMKNSFISVIIPAFNRASMIDQCINSVLQQTYKLFEVVVVDDGSTDDTANIVQDLINQYPQSIKYIYQENSGPAIARNTGLSASDGEFVQYLDSDDLLEPSKFELQVKALQADPFADVVYCQTLRTDVVTGETITWARTSEQIERIFPDFLIHRGWHTISPLWRRRLYNRMEDWGDFRCMEDWEHDLRAGMLGIKIAYVPEPLALIQDHCGDRASGLNTGFTPTFTRDFFRAHKSIWLRMKAQKLTDWSYLEQFSRKMFWIARLCGERQLISEANEALSFALEMSQPHRFPWDMHLFQQLTQTLGWPQTTAIGEALRRWKN